MSNNSGQFGRLQPTSAAHSTCKARRASSSSARICSRLRVFGFIPNSVTYLRHVSHFDPNAGNYQRMQSAPQLPSYLGIPFKILVSPFVHFDPETRTTDIMMFNSRNLGALIVAEEPHVKSWEDGQYNILNMSIEETAGIGIVQVGGPSRSRRA
jgi:hypothetical protein